MQFRCFDRGSIPFNGNLLLCSVPNISICEQRLRASASPVWIYNGYYPERRHEPVNSGTKKFKAMSKKKGAFDAQAFLDTAGVAKKVRPLKGAETVFLQGSPADSVMYIQKGAVKITVVSESGREAIITLLGPGDFFGEGCLAGQPLRMGNAKATVPSTVLVIDKKEMQTVLHEQHDLSDLFINYVLTRNIRIEEDLFDHLFNSTEKRLARSLLLLARYGKQENPESVLPKISQETLAEMIGTSRTRVNRFLLIYPSLVNACSTLPCSPH